MFIYTVCLVVGLLFILVSAIFGHFIGGHDGDVGTGGHAEAGFDHSGVPGISFFSPLVLACFITAFGGFGIVFSGFRPTSNVWVSAPLSIGGGFCLAFCVLWLFNAVFSRTQSSSESHVASLAGQAASILSPIPEKGVGEIAYVQGGTRYTAPARSEGGVAIAAGQTVKITRVIGTQFYVESSEAAVANPPSNQPLKI
ncbi:MAG TPA: NfeD family protein [Candidatus Acidoferrum sp.]|jgi:membrane protein implicated in regulation of membrane protease activity|nr:NfeD family protein [Candidatus Acidoferrum sp.]